MASEITMISPQQRPFQLVGRLKAVCVRPWQRFLLFFFPHRPPRWLLLWAPRTCLLAWLLPKKGTRATVRRIAEKLGSRWAKGLRQFGNLQKQVRLRFHTFACIGRQRSAAHLRRKRSTSSHEQRQTLIHSFAPHREPTRSRSHSRRICYLAAGENVLQSVNLWPLTPAPLRRECECIALGSGVESSQANPAL